MNHIPIIKCSKVGNSDDIFDISVTVPDAGLSASDDHHILWIQLYFQNTRDEELISIGKWEYMAFGKDMPFIQPEALGRIQFNENGTIYALVYCDVHGLWETSKYIELEDMGVEPTTC